MARSGKKNVKRPRFERNLNRRRLETEHKHSRKKRGRRSNKKTSLVCADCDSFVKATGEIHIDHPEEATRGPVLVCSSCKASRVAGRRAELERAWMEPFPAEQWYIRPFILPGSAKVPTVDETAEEAQRFITGTPTANERTEQFRSLNLVLAALRRLHILNRHTPFSSMLRKLEKKWRSAKKQGEKLQIEWEALKEATATEALQRYERTAVMVRKALAEDEGRDEPVVPAEWGIPQAFYCTCGRYNLTCEPPVEEWVGPKGWMDDAIDLKPYLSET